MGEYIVCVNNIDIYESKYYVTIGDIYEATRFDYSTLRLQFCYHITCNDIGNIDQIPISLFKELIEHRDDIINDILE